MGSDKAKIATPINPINMPSPGFDSELQGASMVLVWGDGAESIFMAKRNPYGHYLIWTDQTKVCKVALFDDQYSC